MWSFSRGTSKDTHQNGVRENDIKFTIDPTLAIFGDDDTFVSITKFRVWCKGLEIREEGASVVEGNEGDVAKMQKGRNFTYREVHNAGHFWVDEEAVEILKDEVKAFARRL